MILSPTEIDKKRTVELYRYIQPVWGKILKNPELYPEQDLKIIEGLNLQHPTHWSVWGKKLLWSISPLIALTIGLKISQSINSTSGDETENDGFLSYSALKIKSAINHLIHKINLISSGHQPESSLQAFESNPYSDNQLVPSAQVFKYNPKNVHSAPEYRGISPNKEGEYVVDTSESHGMDPISLGEYIDRMIESKSHTKSIQHVKAIETKSTDNVKLDPQHTQQMLDKCLKNVNPATIQIVKEFFRFNYCSPYMNNSLYTEYKFLDQFYRKLKLMIYQIYCWQLIFLTKYADSSFRLVKKHEFLLIEQSIIQKYFNDKVNTKELYPSVISEVISNYEYIQNTVKEGDQKQINTFFKKIYINMESFMNLLNSVDITNLPLKCQEQTRKIINYGVAEINKLFETVVKNMLHLETNYKFY